MYVLYEFNLDNPIEHIIGLTEDKWLAEAWSLGEWHDFQEIVPEHLDLRAAAQLKLERLARELERRSDGNI